MFIPAFTGGLNLMEYFDVYNVCGMVVLLLTSQLAQSSDCSNTHFTIEVTNSSNGIFTAKEGTTQRITTNVTTVTSCNEWHLLVIENKNPVCRFKINASDVCTVFHGRDKCTCGSRGARGQEYNFIKNVTRKDNGAILKWKFELTNGAINSSESVTLNITYPTRVTSLYVEGYGNMTSVLVPVNISVKVVCSWQDGNPPAAVHLFNSSGDKSSATTTSSDSAHIYFTHRRCYHVEVVRCEASGSERNQSMSLLGMCPPEVRNSTGLFLNVTAGETVSPSFSVLSHTLNITRCQLRQNIEVTVNITVVTAYSAYDSKTNKVIECAVTQNSATDRLGNEPNEKEVCECITNGNVPNVTVTVRIINVNKEDAGNWTLNLFNSLGNVSFNFSLHVSEGNARAGHILSPILQVVAITCGTLICFTIVALIVNYIRKRVAGGPLRHSNDQSGTAECSTKKDPTDNFCFPSESPYDEINDSDIELIITNNFNNRPGQSDLGGTDACEMIVNELYHVNAK